MKEQNCTCVVEEEYCNSFDIVKETNQGALILRNRFTGMLYKIHNLKQLKKVINNNKSKEVKT